MNKVLQVVNQKGIPFNVRFVEKGDKYGRNDALTYQNNEPIVVFYDDRYKIDHPELGQIVSTYHVSTIMEIEEGYTLILDGGVPNWRISPENVKEIKQWLKELL